MATNIHPSAVVDPEARICSGARIGPFCVVGPDVELETGVDLMSHVTITGCTFLGEGTRVFPFVSLGHPPQDLKYRGELSSLIIGKNNVIREHVTMNPGTKGGGMVTQVGNDCLFMIGVHIAHDCVIHDHVIMANNVTLAGHVEVGEWAVLGGLSAVHQFVRIGRYAMVGGMSGVESDVIPYGSVVGNRARLSGLNIIGLKRREFSRDGIHALRNAYRLLFAQEGTLQERLADVANLFKENKAVMEIVEFIRTDSSRAICQPRMENGI